MLQLDAHVQSGDDGIYHASRCHSIGLLPTGAGCESRVAWVRLIFFGMGFATWLLCSLSLRCTD
ncbi:hypothetical protein O9929_05495 [Vibrio lentus]|nr:hypothetical protein [Vibrio lentus]